MMLSRKNEVSLGVFGYTEIKQNSTCTTELASSIILKFLFPK